jgi:hypothetical protein
MINSTGRVLFKEFEEWRFGSLDDASCASMPPTSLRRRDTAEIPIQARFRYNWCYHIEYQVWVEISWEDYRGLAPFLGLVELRPPKVALLLPDTDACSVIRTGGDIEVFPEKMGVLRPPVPITPDAPLFINVWDYIKKDWACVLINQVVTRPDQSTTTIAQMLFNAYFGYSKYRQIYTHLTITDDRHFAESGLLLVHMPNRNIDNPKYIYGTCRLKLDYNNQTYEKNLATHYYQNYSQWNKLA